MSLLSVKKISKSFSGRKVVQSVSFSVSSGQIVGLLGPNGAGKTTSFYMVAGFISVDSGLVKIMDEDVTSSPMFERARKGLAYLPQESSIFRKLTVSENILVALEAHGVEGNTKFERLRALLKDFHIEHIKDEYGYSLSGGERRRVEIARALSVKPNILLLDEPFAGIDPIAVADIRSIIVRLKDQGIGILITDHNVRETLGVCDYSYILKEGKIEVAGTAKEIVNSDIAKKYYLGDDFRL